MSLPHDFAFVFEIDPLSWEAVTRSCCLEHSFPEQIEPRSPIPLPFDQLEAGDLPFQSGLDSEERSARLHRRLILRDPCDKGMQSGERTPGDLLQPAISSCSFPVRSRIMRANCCTSSLHVFLLPHVEWIGIASRVVSSDSHRLGMAHS